MTNRERILKTLRDAFERELKEADDEQLAMIAKDLSDLIICRDCPCANELYDCKYLDCYEGILEYLKEHGDKEHENNL